MLNHLDTDCGTTPPHNLYGKPNVFGIDVRDDVQALLAGQGIVMRKANLIFEQIPFEDNYFSSVSAIDFLEHIPRQICLGSSNEVIYPFIRLMNEIWRVLEPGGRLIAVTPAYHSPLTFADPTHVNYISVGTHEYFCGDNPMGGIYGFHGKFKVLIAKRSAPSNFSKMPPSPWRSFVRALARRVSGKGIHYMIWDLEAVK